MRKFKVHVFVVSVTEATMPIVCSMRARVRAVVYHDIEWKCTVDVLHGVDQRSVCEGQQPSQRRRVVKAVGAAI
jgi:hypothetical protein